MKKLQDSTAAKVCAVLVLLAAAFAAGVFGVRTLLSLPSVFTDSWQQSGRYSNALNIRERELIDGVQLAYELTLLENRLETEEASAALRADAEALRESRAATEELFARNSTWFRFRLMSAGTGEVLGSNLNEDESMIKAVSDVYRTTFELTEDVLWIGHSSYGENGEYEVPSLNQADPTEEHPVKLVLEYGVPEEVRASVKDEFYWTWRLWETDRAEFDQCLTGFLNLSALTLIALVWLLWTSGHKRGKEGITVTWQERIFFDVYAMVVIAAEIFLVFTVIWAVEETYLHSAYTFYWQGNSDASEPYSVLGIVGAAALCTGAVGAVTLLLRTFAVRIKAGCLGRTTLLCRVCGGTVRTVHEFLRSLPLTWKVVVGFGGYTVLVFWLVTAGGYDGMWIFVFWMLQLVLLMFAAWWSLNYFRLRKGTKTIAKGDLEYQIDTRHMPYDLRLQAEDLNNISVGLAGAVDEKMKSERFKAELITNVSHD